MCRDDLKQALMELRLKITAQHLEAQAKVLRKIFAVCSVIEELTLFEQAVIVKPGKVVVG